MNGIDAWRRLVRHIDHGRDLRLDDLRQEMKTMHLKPIKTIGDVEQGVAAFENSIYEFAQAGGTPPSDKEMKDDLLRMLPERIQLDLLWSASDQSKNFAQFRDLVVTASAKMLNIQKPQRGIHQVAPEQPEVNARLPANIEMEDLAMFEGVTNTDDLIAAFQRYNKAKSGNNNGGTGGKFQQRRDTRQQRQTDTRPARKCPNCGESHEARSCPKPTVAVSDRKCWTCGEKHMAKDCPKKGNQVKAI